MVRTAGAMVLAAIVASPAASEGQFDLICTAKSQKSPTRYVIDIAAGEWCWAPCRGTHKLADVTSTTITFTDTKAAYAGALTSHQYVDRVTGEWTFFTSDRYGTDTIRGTCELAPFSGFGADRAKF